MVTKQELVNGYETEIKYQRHMLENLGRWFSLLFIIASIGVVLIYLFHKSFLPLLILGILLALVGILGMIVFGYGIYRGRINLQKVIDDFNQRAYHQGNTIYPDDEIHDMPVSVVQDIVFRSKTFADVKRLLLDYAAKNKYAAQLYNLTPETINRLFAVYEN
mgnify:CR=1 FL=1